MMQPVATMIAAGIIAVAVIFLFRYEMLAHSTGVYRLNRLTGHLAECLDFKIF